MAIKYLKRYGLPVVENGYDICFIRPGTKRPLGEDWQTKTHGPKRIASAIEEGRGGYGVGIRTKETIGFDIDCYDKKLVAHMVRCVEDLCGETIQRIGFAPKTLLVYRAAENFAKVQSKVFVDDEGRDVKLEVLADGQQFVAFHIHPDTQMPYVWKDDRSVLDVRQEDLPDITRDDALEMVAEFERQCRKRGWQEKSTVKRLTSGGSGREIWRDDPFLTDKAKVDLSPDEIVKKLAMVPGAEDYDTWFHVGMALAHQSDLEQWGLDAWHEWSSQAPNYDMDALDEKWPTFDIEGKKREPLTARFILKMAQEEEQRVSGEQLDEIKRAIKKCSNDREFAAVMDKIRHITFSPIIREGLVGLLKETIKKKTESLMPIGTIRRAIAFQNPEDKAKPAWLRNWVYIQQDDTFYNSKTRQVVSTKGFDLTFGRFLLTKSDVLEGISVPKNSATQVAVHRYQVPSVANKMYLPGEDEFFDANGLPYVNSYSDATAPETPDVLSKEQLKMCQRVERHLEHMFSNERDRKLLLSWLAYIVQTNGRVNWSPVLQGVEGDGKTFFGMMMASVLGGENVNIINGDQLAEQYTSWAENSIVLMIEEVRLHGSDRFAVINRVKTYITNATVTVRRMHTNSYKVINTVNYLLTTNHKDGVPVNDSSTRYFPMFSRWQTKEALDAFNAEHPNYYKELYEAIESHGGALRRWLLDHKLHPDFDPLARATASSSLREMKYLNQSEQDEVIAGIPPFSPSPDHPDDLTRTLLSTARLSEHFANEEVTYPYGAAIKRLLAEAGYTFLTKLTHNQTTTNYWSQTPAKFQNAEGRTDNQAIHEYLDRI